MNHKDDNSKCSSSMSSSNEKFIWNYCPRDMLFEIFSHLILTRCICDLFNASLTCTAWNKVAVCLFYLCFIIEIMFCI